MKIILFGKNGQVGWELNRLLRPLGQVVALGRDSADFSDPESLREVVKKVKPDVIVNAVAYTSVDKAEDEEDLANRINGIAPGVLAEEALNINALLIHYSTDYVFDGAKDSAYTEQDKANPLNAYGRSKLMGEQLVQRTGCDYLIFRTSWVYSTRGHNFLLTVLNLAEERKELSIVGDQTGSPTWARMIAGVSAICINQSCLEKRDNLFSSGLYNMTSSGVTSWHGFAQSIVEIAGKQRSKPFIVERINSISTAEYPTPAKRPMNSRLSSNKLEEKFGLKMPDWSTELDLCIEDVS